MKKTPLITLATAAAIAGVGAATSSNQVAAATSTTTTKAPDPSNTAEKNVQAAQTNVDTAKAASDKTQQAKQTASQTLTDAKKSRQQAQTASDQAQATKARATPAGIQKAQQAVDDAQTTQKAAQTTADTAQSEVADAQQAVTQAETAQKAADAITAKAQSAVADAQKQVTTQTPADTKAAQQAVTAAQTAVTTDTAANTKAQQAATQADTAVANAQQTATSAQSAVDKTAATVKAQQGTGGLKMPAGYMDAYHSWPDSDDLSDAQREKLEAAAEKRLIQAKSQVVMLGYTPTDADKAEEIADMTKLTQAQTRELSEFAASVLNDIRQQMGISALQVTDGSTIAAPMVGGTGEAMLHQFYGNPSGYDINPDFSQSVAKAAGIPIGRSNSYEDDNGKTIVEVYGDGYMEDIGSEWGWDLSNGDKTGTMSNLKAGVVAYLGMMLDGTNYATNSADITATGPWRAEADRHYDGTPDLVDDLLLGEGSQGTSDPYDYLGVTIDENGQLRFIFQSMTGVSKSAAYFNNATTPAPIAHPTDPQAASRLATQQAALTKAQQALTDAKAAQTKAASAKTAAATKLAASQAALKAAQTALTKAQATAPKDSTALTQAKQALAQAQTKLTQAQAAAAQIKVQVDATYQTLAEKQAAADKAQQALTAAKAAVTKAQAWLNALQNADANVETAQAALTDAEQAVVAAQKAYDETIAPAKAAADQLTKAQAQLTTAQAQLAAVKQHQAQVKALADQSLQKHQARPLQTKTPVTKAAATKAAAAIQKAKPAVATMPQAGEAAQSGLLGLVGAALLSLIGFGAYNLKKRV